MTIVLVGQTASGKTAVSKELEKLGYKRVVTTTTRPPRPGEIDGEDYNFIGKADFEILQKTGYFAECSAYNMVCGTHYWGSPTQAYLSNSKQVIVLNPEGVEQIMERGVACLVIYLKPPIDILKERAIRRGDDPNEVVRRLENDQPKFDNLEKLGFFSLIIDTAKTCSLKAAEQIDTFFKLQTGNFPG